MNCEIDTFFLFNFPCKYQHFFFFLHFLLEWSYYRELSLVIGSRYNVVYPSLTAMKPSDVIDY